MLVWLKFSVNAHVKSLSDKIELNPSVIRERQGHVSCVDLIRDRSTVDSLSIAAGTPDAFLGKPSRPLRAVAGHGGNKRWKKRGNGRWRPVNQFPRFRLKTPPVISFF